MSKLSSLKGVVGGLAGSFVSRNNDVDGYWALGLLKSFANKTGADQVRVTVVPSDSEQPEPLRSIAQLYRTKLEQLMTGARLDLRSVSSAEIVTTFRLSADEAARAIAGTRGAPFRSEVLVVDVRGRTHSRAFYSLCSEHDPSREQSRRVLTAAQPVIPADAPKAARR